MQIKIRGAGGDILWGERGRAALALGPWLLEQKAGAWHLTARDVRVVNAFYARQVPLLFVAPRSGRIGFGLWPIVTSTLTDGRLTATLGAPEY